MQILAAPFAGIAGDYQSIATVNVGSGGQATVVFSSIPSTFKHLQIRAITRDTQVANSIGAFRMTVNSDILSTYTRHVLAGDGSSATSGFNSTTGFCFTGLYVTGGSSANMFGVNIIDILDYSNTNKNKTFRVLSGVDKNGSGEVALTSNLFPSLSAITTLSFAPTLTSNWAQHTQFALYGIKG
jgi:hypothetical protein